MKWHADIRHVAVVVGLVLGLDVLAQEGGSSAPESSIGGSASMGKPVFVQDIAAESVDAVKVVDEFSLAIRAGRIADAAKLLDPKVLVLESGSSERSRNEYLAEHAAADAAYLQTMRQQLRYRQARAEGDIAWVGTESILQKTGAGKPSTQLSTETMVLKRSANGWKIVHIHWSSRPGAGS